MGSISSPLVAMQLDSGVEGYKQARPLPQSVSVQQADRQAGGLLPLNPLAVIEVEWSTIVRRITKVCILPLLCVNLE